MGECAHDFLERVQTGDPADGYCAICIADHIAALEQERDEWKNLAKSYEGVFSERDEAYAAIRAAHPDCPHIPSPHVCRTCRWRQEHAPAIARATNQPTPPDPEPPFHFCDQIRENLVGPKSACAFCRATGEEP